MPWKIENHLVKEELMAVMILDERESGVEVGGMCVFNKDQADFFLAFSFSFWYYFSHWKT